MNPESLIDNKLWQRLKLGDESAFSVLFERYYPSLINYGNSLMPYSGHCGDCVQDVFADLWLYRQTLGEEVIVKAYLLGSVRKRIGRLYQRDKIFRQSASIDSVEFSMNFTIEDQLIANEELAANVRQLNYLINALPARQKEALYLRYYQALDIDQIANMLNITNQSASNLLHRAILHLRQDWKGDLTLIYLCFSIGFHI